MISVSAVKAAGRLYQATVNVGDGKTQQRGVRRRPVDIRRGKPARKCSLESEANLRHEASRCVLRL